MSRCVASNSSRTHCSRAISNALANFLLSVSECSTSVEFVCSRLVEDESSTLARFECPALVKDGSSTLAPFECAALVGDENPTLAWFDSSKLSAFECSKPVELESPTLVEIECSVAQAGAGPAAASCGQITLESGFASHWPSNVAHLAGLSLFLTK